MASTINPEFCEMIAEYFITPLSPKSNYVPQEYRLPIAMLDEINVCVELYRYNYSTHGTNPSPDEYGIKVDCSDLYEGSGDDDSNQRRLHTKTDFKTIMDALKYFMEEFIPNFKLDNLNGRFVTKDTAKRENLLIEFCGLFSANERVKPQYERCVVCYDLTRTKTECDHTLCLRCANKMDFEEDEDGHGFKCPLCRAISDKLNN